MLATANYYIVYRNISAVTSEKASITVILYCGTANKFILFR